MVRFGSLITHAKFQKAAMMGKFLQIEMKIRRKSQNMKISTPDELFIDYIKRLKIGTITFLMKRASK